MTPAEEQEAVRRAREIQVSKAWQELSLDENFKTVFELDLQVHFNLHRASFQAGDEFNPHAAAQRDGQKQVISHITRRIAVATANLDQDDDKPTKPTQAS